MVMPTDQWALLKNKILKQKKNCEVKPLTEEEFKRICDEAVLSFCSQNMLLEVTPPVQICGDTHGQFKDLLRILNYGGYPPRSRYLFLGDYVDRGPMSLETVVLLMLYKIRYPDRMYMLRGNHEFDNLNNIYGFKTECERRYGSLNIWKMLNNAFCYMPIAALVGRRLFCMHGGIPLHLTDWNQVRTIKRPMITLVDSISTDLLWADPVLNQKGWRGSVRGVSYGFGEDVVYKFCRTMDIDMIVRAHQVVQNGFEFFASNHLVTIFSAPNYCGSFDNDAGMLIVDADLKCTVKQLRPPRAPTIQHERPTNQKIKGT